MTSFTNPGVGQFPLLLLVRFCGFKCGSASAAPDASSLAKKDVTLHPQAVLAWCVPETPPFFSYQKTLRPLQSG